MEKQLQVLALQSAVEEKTTKTQRSLYGLMPVGLGPEI